MRTASIIAVLLFASVALGQSPTPGPLTVVFDQPQQACAPQLLSCVSQVNGVPVCPFGRIAWYPLPGQPYTIQMGYPKVDSKGVPIDTSKCVSTLPPNLPFTDLNWLTAPHW